MRTTLTVAAASAIVTRYATATAAQDLTLAHAILDLNVTHRMSVRDIAALTADLSRPIGKTRVGVILKAIKAADPDVTADDFRTALKAATADNTRKPVTAEASETETDTLTDGKGKRVPSGDSVTTDPIQALADLAAAFGDREDFRAAVIALSNTYAPIVLVATPKRSRQAA